ncbi:hypothetical protein SDRG_08546 [Saprolegnia diclina VS20]|uniref:FYVE-type domain-containing protein n=1 Tax=Saprolegnia diclina (strain VS20) TaxID=1156394 RepID=T0QJE0_SAPDV|nr:hypothetical protein SDRG_08546 [Saprolegnia diclina VS20]EQC33865.1 hypothetical protein SDRG_08546 [Saprolegnia diclina VS20]|eukprot:XP_008612660.1 hypothetical protein SDRG_08546 [Saprolegnia diclina VS20]
MYPLRDDAFVCPPPMPSQVAHYTQLGETTFDQFLESTLTKPSATSWDHVATYDSVALYKGTVPINADSLVVPYRAVTTARATIEEIAHIHSFETRAQCAHFTKHYAEDILDMFTLYSFLPRTKQDPFKQVYLKWTACASPMAAVSNRDFTYLECQDAFETPAGRRGWAFCQVSVDLPFLPSLETSALALVRGQLLRTGCVFVETATPGVVDVIYHICADLKGHIPQWTYKLGMKTRALSVLHIEKNVTRLRLSAQQMRAKAAATKLPRPGVHCSVCTKPFRFHRVHHCRSCAKAVCSKCSQKYKLPSMDDLVRVCVRCSEAVRYGPASDLVVSGYGTPRSDASSEPWWTTELMTPPPMTPVATPKASPKVDLSYLSTFGPK